MQATKSISTRRSQEVESAEDAENEKLNAVAAIQD